VIAAAIVVAVASLAPSDAPPARCHPSEAASRLLVLNFYRRALVQKDIRGAFEAFMTPDFVDHKPDVAGGGRAATIKLLEGYIRELPRASWQVVRSIADHDMVVLHVRFDPEPGAPPYAIADFFRVKDCRIAEHWDVVAPPKAGPNAQSRF
jgi:predicted SnoaL-like aldol condensation-catalyzing enzyme